jgi:L1 cell adhesion molecule like protein
MTKDNNNLGTFELSGIPPMPRGRPQIEVSFDIDANGILQVNATDKTTGKMSNITITNDKGRLSKEQVEEMIRKADEMADEDKKAKERIESKNSLEQYSYNLKQSLTEDGVKDKLSDVDKQKIGNACDEAIKFMEINSDSTKEEFDNERKKLEAIAMPIMSKIYQQNGDMPGYNGDEDPVVDVD